MSDRYVRNPKQSQRTVFSAERLFSGEELVVCKTRGQEKEAHTDARLVTDKK